MMVAMTVIGFTSATRSRKRSRHVAQNLALAGVALGTAGHIESAVVLIVTIATLCVAQLVLSLGRISAPLHHRESTAA